MLWLYLTLGAIPVGMAIAALLIPTPSGKCIGFLFFTPAAVLGFFFSIFLPPLPVVGAIILYSLAAFSRKAMIEFACMLSGLVYAMAVYIHIHSYLGSGGFPALLMLGSIAGTLFGVWLTRHMPSRTLTRKRIIFSVAMLVCCAIMLFSFLFSTKLANTVALLQSPAISGSLMRLGAIPAAPVEDALFAQAKQEGTHAAFFQHMLLAKRDRYASHPQQSSFQIIRKLEKEYNSPELVPVVLDLLQQNKLPDSSQTLWHLVDIFHEEEEPVLLHELMQRGLFTGALRNSKGTTVLAELVRLNRNAKIRAILQHTGQAELQNTVLLENKHGISALTQAVLNDNEELFLLLLPYAPSLYQTYSHGRNLLHFACMNSSPRILAWLLQQPVPPYQPWATAQDNTAAMPLHYAAMGTFSQGMRLLVQSGADVNAQDTQGRTPLITAMEIPTTQKHPLHGIGVYISKEEIPNKYATLQTMLLLTPTEVNTRDAAGRTPLHYAALTPGVIDWHKNVYRSIISTLLELGANPASQEAQGKTALEYLRSSPYKYPPRSQQVDKAIETLEALTPVATPGKTEQ